MVSSPDEWKNLERDDKPQTNNKQPHDFPGILINGVYHLPTIMGQNYAELTIDWEEKAVCFCIELLAGFTNITKYLAENGLCCRYRDFRHYLRLFFLQLYDEFYIVYIF